MLKPIVRHWKLFRLANKKQTDKAIYCKKHRKLVSCNACYVCFVNNLMKTAKNSLNLGGAETRPLCKEREGIVNGKPFTLQKPPQKRKQMSIKAFQARIKKSRQKH